MCFSIILAPFAMAREESQMSLEWSEKPILQPNFNFSKQFKFNE